MAGWAYILRCSDKSYYVGSTSHDDVNTRVDEHNDARYFGYTTSRRPVFLLWARRFEDLKDAHQTERRLKGWSRAKKEALIEQDAGGLKSLSRRRAGKPIQNAPSLTKCELANMAQATGARHPEVRPKGAPKDE